MKKLLVLMLVLGLTSAANATLSFYIDGSDAGDSIDVAQGEAVIIQIYSDDTSNWLRYIGMDISTMSAFGTVGSGTAYSGAGESGYISPYYESGWMDGFEVQTTSISGQVVAGIQHAFVYTAPTADGSTRLGIFAPPNYSWDQDEVDLLNINVPEPITIALLGLGGLFLRRRK